MQHQRFTVVQVRSGAFPLYELRDADKATVDYSQDAEDMFELADAMNSLDQTVNGGAR
jgi:hypothetical protein